MTSIRRMREEIEFLGQLTRTLETQVNTARELLLQPQPANSFYGNGFPTRLDQLAEQFSEVFAVELAEALQIDWSKP